MSEFDRAIAGLIVGAIFIVLIALFWAGVPTCEATLHELHPTWTTSVRECICDHRIQIGMTSNMVRIAWGEPSSIHRKIDATGVTKMWVYRSSTSITYVYFDGDLVTTIIQ